MTGSPYRRRRIFWAITLSCIALYWFLPRPLSLSLPASFSLLAHSETPPAMRLRIQEIHGLLHLVAQSNGHLPPGTDGSQELDLQVYANAAGGEDDWATFFQQLQTETPVIVFSKTYCPYSKRGKELLNSYKLVPEPKIIELDLRPDADIIKQILIRLTGRGTVPNVLLKGESIGGSDDIHELHNKDELKGMFEERGVQVTGNV